MRNGPETTLLGGVKSIPESGSSKASRSNYGVFLFLHGPMIQPSITVLYKLKQTLAYHKCD